jgi:hypothetical protein
VTARVVGSSVIMRLRGILLAAAIPTVTALHQHVVAYSASLVETTTPIIEGMVISISSPANR